MTAPLIAFYAIASSVVILALVVVAYFLWTMRFILKSIKKEREGK